MAWSEELTHFHCRIPSYRPDSPVHHWVVGLIFGTPEPTNIGTLGPEEMQGYMPPYCFHCGHDFHAPEGYPLECPGPGPDDE